MLGAIFHSEMREIRAPQAVLEFDCNAPLDSFRELEAPSYDHVKFHRNLFDNLDIESFQRRYSSRMIRRAAECASRFRSDRICAPDANLAMDLALAFRQATAGAGPDETSEVTGRQFVSRKIL